MANLYLKFIWLCIISFGVNLLIMAKNSVMSYFHHTFLMGT